MAYGTIKVDTITFTNGGVDKSVSISGLVQNPTFSGNVTSTGTISGATITGNAGAFTTITGGVATITSGVFSGRVGIGTTSPSYKLDVQGGVISAGNGTIYGGISYSTRPEIGSISNHDCGFITNNTTRMLLDISGDLGIGTPDPVNYTNFRTVTLEGTNGSIIHFRNSANTFVSEVSLYSTEFQIKTTGALPLTFGTNNTERLRIDSSGRVGIGTSSPGYLLDVVGTVNANATFRASNGTHVGIFGSEAFSAGVVGLGSDSNHPLVFGTNSAERARIDSSGRLLVGTSSTSANTTVLFQGTSANVNDGAAIRLAAGAATPANGTNLGYLFFSDSSHTASAGIQAQRDGGTWTTNSSLPSRLMFSTTANGAASPTERMRITNDGRIGLGTSSVYSATRADTYTNNSVWFAHTFRQDEATGYGIGIGSDGTSLALFYPNSGLIGGPVGQISHDGSSTTYATSSDYRLKENIAAVTDGITRLQQLKPRRFNFKANPGHTVDGFIAHEAAEVVPECATGVKDEVNADGNPVYQGIDQSKLVPLLTAALQEAVAKIETLEAKVAALEAA